MDEKQSLFKTAVSDPVVRLAALAGAAVGGVLVVALFIIFDVPAPPMTPSPTVQKPSAAITPERTQADRKPKAIVEKVPTDGQFEALRNTEVPERTPAVIEPKSSIADTRAEAEPVVSTYRKKPLETMEDLIDEVAPTVLPQTSSLPTTETVKPAPKPLTPAHPAKHLQSGPPKIAIVIDDMGVDRRRSARAIELPGKITLSFLPYAGALAAQTELASAKGHELMLHVAMEPESTEVDPGPNALLSGISEKELRANLDWNLAQMTGYIGVNNHMGSRFTRDIDGMRVVMAELSRRGLFFLDSVTSRSSVASIAAREAQVPFTKRHIFIDHKDDSDYVNGQLAKIERLAKKQGFAVAIGHPRDKTLTALEKWLPTLAEKGFELIGVSSLFAKPARPAAEMETSG